uniref:Uncharacterized protein n=1 Tax=Oryza meridionalis TaxID=40149 RepID=A0A0E0C4W5_9ORYZ
MKKRRGNGSSAFLLRGTHLAAAAAAAYGDGREGQRAASPPEEDAAQLLAMDTTKRPLRLTAPSFSLSLSSCSVTNPFLRNQSDTVNVSSLLPYLLANWGATDGIVLVNSLLLLLDCSAIAYVKIEKLMLHIVIAGSIYCTASRVTFLDGAISSVIFVLLSDANCQMDVSSWIISASHLPIHGQTSRQDRGPIWIIVINHASPVYSRAGTLGSYKSRIYGRALSGGNVDFRTRVLFAFINCAPAGPREPRIMRSSATHVAGHPWDFRQAYRLAATVSHPLLLLQCYCSTQIHAYICPAGICRSRREEKGRNLRQHPKAPNRGHYSRCVSTCMVHLQESQRYLCVTIISLRDTTLAPTDQDIKEHFGSGEEGGKQYCPLICYVMVVEAYH